MGHDIVHEEQILPIAQVSFPTVPTRLICQNMLLRTGVGHILSGTRFVLAEEAGEDADTLSCLSDWEQGLFLICESHFREDCGDIVTDLKTRFPAARVVLLGEEPEPRKIMQLLQAGLDGFCPRSMSHQALIKVLELVMHGETFVPACAGLALIEQSLKGPSMRFGASVALMAAENSAALLDKLSEREAQILNCLTRGASNKLIARELGVAEATVKVHIKAILRKVKACNRTQAAMWAVDHFDSLQERTCINPTIRR